jgi:hypothetical protein
MFTYKSFRINTFASTLSIDSNQLPETLEPFGIGSYEKQGKGER